MNIEVNILKNAKIRGLKIATAESCTGGMVSASLTDLPGSSSIFEFGFVTYSNEAKQKLLGVQAKTLNDFGAVSEQTAYEMAVGAMQSSNADIAISISGIAGPGGSDFKPEGRVCFGIATNDSVKTETVDFGAIGRENVRKAARDHALSMILSAVE